MNAKRCCWCWAFLLGTISRGGNKSRSSYCKAWLMLDSCWQGFHSISLSHPVEHLATYCKLEPWNPVYINLSAQCFCPLCNLLVIAYTVSAFFSLEAQGNLDNSLHSFLSRLRIAFEDKKIIAQ